MIHSHNFSINLGSIETNKIWIIKYYTDTKHFFLLSGWHIYIKQIHDEFVAKYIHIFKARKFWGSLIWRLVRILNTILRGNLIWRIRIFIKFRGNLADSHFLISFAVSGWKYWLLFLLNLVRYSLLVFSPTFFNDNLKKYQIHIYR